MGMAWDMCTFLMSMQIYTSKFSQNLNCLNFAHWSTRGTSLIHSQPIRQLIRISIRNALKVVESKRLLTTILRNERIVALKAIEMSADRKHRSLMLQYSNWVSFL
jgi:hypothetical protein